MESVTRREVHFRRFRSIYDEKEASAFFAEKGARTIYRMLGTGDGVGTIVWTGRLS